MGKAAGTTPKKRVTFRKPYPRDSVHSHSGNPAALPLTFERLITEEDPYITELLCIRDKVGEIIPFRYNPVQRVIQDTRHRLLRQQRPQRILILKARREGVTTLIQGVAFKGTATVPNFQALTLAHEDKTTEKTFRIANLFYDRLPEDFKPRRLTSSNKRDLNFPDLNSLFSIGTAGSRGIARGDTLSIVHWAEVAWSPGSKEDQRKLLAGMTEAASGGEVILETTPNGVGDLFHEKFTEARKGKNEWTALFFAWFDDPTYRIALDDDARRYIMSHLSDEEKALVRKHKLDSEQIAWRRQQIRELRHLFPQEYPEDAEACFLVSGTCFFDKQKLNARLQGCRPPLRKEMNGDLIVWRDPEEGHKYVGGGDVAEGLKSGNNCVCGFVDIETGEQVAVLRGKWPPDEFGRLTAKIGDHYNRALLAIERNNHGHSALNTLANVLDYPNLYYHLEYDSRGGSSPVLGFPTTPKTRPILLDDLRGAVEDGYMIVHDEALISECRTFGPNDRGKLTAQHGAKDDSLFGWGIAWQVRKQCVRQDSTEVSRAHAEGVSPVGSNRIFPMQRESADVASVGIGPYQTEGSIPGRIF